MDERTLHLGFAWRDLDAVWHLLASHRPTLRHDRWDAWGERLDPCRRTPFAHVSLSASGQTHDEVVSTVEHLLSGHPAGTWVAVETAADDTTAFDGGGRIWHRLDPPGSSLVVETRVPPH